MNHINTGNAGEYFVAAELERRGFTVGVPMSNVKDYDILCANKSGKQFALQIKTTLRGNNRWILNQKCEKIVADNVFYVFVHLHQLGNPSYFIVPSKYVAETVYSGYKKWLNTPRRDGRPHKSGNMRNIVFPNNTYLNRWDYLD